MGFMPGLEKAVDSAGDVLFSSFAATLAETPQRQAFERLVLQRSGMKGERFERLSDVAGYEFVPLAVESFGRLGKEAARLLNDLGDVAADGCASKDTFVRIVRQELSCALCKGNAQLYDRSLISVARGVGRGFSPGLDTAVDEAGDV